MHIGELSRRLGVTPQHIRILEWSGVIPRADRDDLNARIYRERDLEALREIGVGSRPSRLRKLEKVLQ